jgi:transposase-like protein
MNPVSEYAALRRFIRNLHQSQIKYLNNIIEQDHRAVKRMTRPMLNFKSFRLPAPCSPVSK